MLARRFSKFWGVRNVEVLGRRDQKIRVFSRHVEKTHFVGFLLNLQGVEIT